MAARSVQTPFPGAVSQTPLPGLASKKSNGLLTVKTAAWTETERKTPRSVIPIATPQRLVSEYCIIKFPEETKKRIHVLMASSVPQTKPVKSVYFQPLFQKTFVKFGNKSSPISKI